jgi:hypothetical protein
MPKIEELSEQELLELLKYDPESERLFRELEASLTELRELLGKKGPFSLDVD